MVPGSGEGRVNADVLVVGAGSAGVAAVAALLHQRPDDGAALPSTRRVAWVDPAFDSGRLDRFQAVPCNTKVDLLLGQKFFGHPLLGPFSREVAPALRALEASGRPLLGSADPSVKGWTDLGACKAVYDAATAALLDSPYVTSVRGSVASLRRSPGRKDALEGEWLATVHRAGGNSKECEVAARYVVLATGSEPKRCGWNVIGKSLGGGAHGGSLEPTASSSGAASAGSAPSRHAPQVAAAGLDGRPVLLSGEDTFDVGRFRERLERMKNPAVAVVGNSHTAAIALSNIHSLLTPLDLQRVAVFARRPTRLAEWMPELGTYRYTSTGLKGFGAVFGCEHMMAAAPSRASAGTLASSRSTMARADAGAPYDCVGTSGAVGSAVGGSVRPSTVPTKFGTPCPLMEVLPLDAFLPSEWDVVIDCTGYVPTALPVFTLQAGSGGAARSSPGAGAPALVGLPSRDEGTGQLEGLPGVYAVGAPWPEPPGRFWGRGYEDAEGFKSEGSFIGFHLFFDRAALVAKEIARL